MLSLYWTWTSCQAHAEQPTLPDCRARICYALRWPTSSLMYQLIHLIYLKMNPRSATVSIKREVRLTVTFCKSRSYILTTPLEKKQMSTNLIQGWNDYRRLHEGWVLPCRLSFGRNEGGQRSPKQRRQRSGSRTHDSQACHTPSFLSSRRYRRNRLADYRKGIQIADQRVARDRSLNTQRDSWIWTLPNSEFQKRGGFQLCPGIWCILWDLYMNTLERKEANRREFEPTGALGYGLPVAWH